MATASEPAAAPAQAGDGAALHEQVAQLEAELAELRGTVQSLQQQLGLSRLGQG